MMKGIRATWPTFVRETGLRIVQRSFALVSIQPFREDALLGDPEAGTIIRRPHGLAGTGMGAMGVLRFFLALCVIAFHLTQQLPVLGMLAVNFFYIISGFLMTLVLNEVYRFDFGRFSANRVLRLFPAYFAVAICVFALHVSTPESRQFHPSWQNASQPPDVLANIFIFPWAFLSDPIVSTPFDIFHSDVDRYRLVPSTWSVGVELICYVLLWAASARSPVLAFVTLGLALLWEGYFVFLHPNPKMLYAPWTAAMIPFSLGSLAYHLRAYAPDLAPLRSKSWFTTLVAGVTIAVFTSIWFLDFPSNINTPSYVATFLIGSLSVFILQRTRPSGRFADIDRHLGDLSYPMFLAQYVAAAAIYQLLPSGTTPRGWLILATGLLATLAMAEAIVLIIDRPIVALRDRIRNRSGRTGPP